MALSPDVVRAWIEGFSRPSRKLLADVLWPFIRCWLVVSLVSCLSKTAFQHICMEELGDLSLAIDDEHGVPFPAHPRLSVVLNLVVIQRRGKCCDCTPLPFYSWPGWLFYLQYPSFQVRMISSRIEYNHSCGRERRALG